MCYIKGKHLRAFFVGIKSWFAKNIAEAPKFMI